MSEGLTPARRGRHDIGGAWEVPGTARFAQHGGRRGAKDETMPGLVSVRWRLLVAFLGISAFAVLAAAASMWAFLELGRVVERTTEKRAPAALASLELSRQAERIAAAAPALLAAPNEAGRAEVSADIRTQLAGLEAILAKLRDTSAAAVVGPIEGAVAGLGSNLDALDRLVAERLATAQAKAKLLSRLSATVVGTHRLVTPGILVLDSQIAAWRRARGDGSGEALARAVAGFVPLQKAQLEIAAVNDSLLKAAGAPSPADLSLLSFPLKRSFSALEAIASEFDPSLRGRFLDRVGELGALAEGSEGLPAARERELDALGRGERLLAENAALSRGLTEAVDRLVAGAKADIAAAGTEFETCSAVQLERARHDRARQSFELGSDRLALCRPSAGRPAQGALRQHAPDRRG